MKRKIKKNLCITLFILSYLLFFIFLIFLWIAPIIATIVTDEALYLSFTIPIAFLSYCYSCIKDTERITIADMIGNFYFSLFSYEEIKAWVNR